MHLQRGIRQHRLHCFLLYMKLHNSAFHAAMRLASRTCSEIWPTFYSLETCSPTLETIAMLKCISAVLMTTAL